MEDYRTADTWLAAFLIVKGYGLLDFDVSNPKRVEFIFEPGAIEMAEPYYKGAEVVALEFASQLRRLKEKMYERIKDNDAGDS